LRGGFVDSVVGLADVGVALEVGRRGVVVGGTRTRRTLRGIDQQIMNAEKAVASSQR
jgi:hypothetical protein